MMGSGSSARKYFSMDATSCSVNVSFSKLISTSLSNKCFSSSCRFLLPEIRKIPSASTSVERREEMDGNIRLAS